MRWRALLLLLLFGFVPAVRAADSVSVKLRRIGLEGFYLPNGNPTLVEIEMKNTVGKPLAFQLSVRQADLESGASATTEEYTLPVSLNPGEERVVNVPVRLSEHPYSVIFAVARDAQGVALGKAGRDPGPKTEGTVIGLLCAAPQVCQSIRESILLTGTSEEQTRKSQLLRVVQLTEPPAVGWAYGSASQVVVATPAESLSNAQREALEIFLHRGGSLILIEDQLKDDIAGGKKVSAEHRETRFLDVYRKHAPEGTLLTAGEGQFLRFRSIAGKDFSEYCEALAFSQSTPKETREIVGRFLRKGEAGNREPLLVWLMRRLGTRFRFPGFLEMLLWIAAYLLLVGAINFVVLRWMGKPEWGWITIPAIAVLFSILLYAVSARNHPTNFGADEMTIYRMDDLSSLATSETKVRISAPVRSTVRPVLPGTMILQHRQQYGFAIDFGPSLAGGDGLIREIQLGDNWETAFPLRRWSFRDMDFEGQRRFAGTIYRDKVGQLHNETGVNFTQAIALDERDVFLLGNFPAGAVVDLGHVPRRAYGDETGRRPFGGQYPGPPFWTRRTAYEPQFTEQEWKGINAEFEALPGRPFSLLELIHGWSRDGKDVFSETKAVFFGLSQEATEGVTLRDHAADRKAASVMIVTLGDWP